MITCIYNHSYIRVCQYHKFNDHKKIMLCVTCTYEGKLLNNVYGAKCACVLNINYCFRCNDVYIYIYYSITITNHNTLVI